MNNAQEARCLLRAHRYGALSTLSQKFDGFPFGSITPYLVDHDGSLIILISTLAEHTKNIQADARVSLICHNQRDPHIQTQGRVTVLGHATRIDDKAQAGARYLRYFPEAQTYFDMHDFYFYRIQPHAIRYIGGFGRIHWVQMPNYAVPDAQEFAQQEDVKLAELNRQPDVLISLLQSHYHFEPNHPFAIGCDCDGMDIRSDGQVWRVDMAV
jgi:putative heme iron utilization protein